MTGNPEAPDGGRAQAGPRSDPPDADRPRSGPVAELALVAGGLGLVGYLLGFVDDSALGGSLIGALLLGGGLLAGSVALPAAGTRVLVPAAVTTVTGALLLLQAVVGGADSAVAIGALVLALLQAAAAGGAALMHAGVVRAPRPRQRKASAPPYGGSSHFLGQQFPGQQYPGQPYPGSYAGHPGEPYPGDQYAGEHAYAQYARYGAPYGVPGYPPPPPYGAPGYDPTLPATGGHPAVPRSGAERQTTVTGQPPAATEVYRSGVPTASGSDAPPVHGSGAHRIAPASGPEVAGSPGGSPTTATGGHPAVPDPASDRDGGDDRTRAIPTRPVDER
jgi:hypothetical protein